MHKMIDLLRQMGGQLTVNEVQIREVVDSVMAEEARRED
jgi:hypothetical protein